MTLIFTCLKKKEKKEKQHTMFNNNAKDSYKEITTFYSLNSVTDQVWQSQHVP